MKIACFKKIKLNLLKYWLMASLIPLISAYASSTPESVHQQEANDFCEVHNPDRWTNYWQGGSEENTELYYQKLAGDIKAIIKTEEFRKIFKDQLEIPPAEYRKAYSNDYVYYRKKISALLDQDWDCEYLKYHYVVEFEKE